MNAAPQIETQAWAHFELPYTRWRIILAYLAVVVVSAFLSLWLMLVSAGLIGALRSGEPPSPGALIGALVFLLQMPFPVIFGIISLSIAAVVVGALGFSVWRWFAERGRTRFADAARAGAVAGGIIVVFEIGGVLMIRISQAVYPGETAIWPPTFTFDDLEPHWLLTKIVFDSICTVGTGAVCGLVARAVAGPPKYRT
jgi:hypothetical protein